MDNFRLILIFSLAMLGLFIYQAWLQDYPPQQPVTPTAAVADSPPTTVVESAAPAGVPDVFVSPNDAQLAPTPAIAAATLTGGPSITPIVVETDLMRLEISPLGGTISSLWLKDYLVAPDDPDDKLRLFKPQTPNMFVAQSGLLGTEPDVLPTHEAAFTSAQQQFSLKDGEDQLVVELLWTSPEGIKVKKTYRFDRGSYVITARQEIVNGSGSGVTAREYAQLQRTELYDPNAANFVYTYTGGVYYTPEDKYKKESFDDMRSKKLDRKVADGWVAMIQHYFLASWIPPRATEQTFYTNVLGDARYIIGMYSPAVSIPAGAAHQFENRLFAGPKLHDTLAEVAPGLELTVDFGWLTIIAEPIYWLLSKIHSFVGNWGWSIIILTILIKLAFYKLSETSYKSMANMRKFTPRLQALKDRYGDDKQRLNQAMMEIYKKEKINPLGGCLPIVVQIPVFISLYWVLLESVELRHAPFALWLDNLTSPDPYFVLPAIMAISMFIQQKLNPPPPDPIQAKIMMSLPLVFGVFFAFFPSGLVLYWTVNNILSIAQQGYITRKIEQAGK